MRSEGARIVVQAWLGTRLLLVLVALLVALGHRRSADDLLANWDVRHFFAIAADGYAAHNDIAFFPGWPLLLRAGASVGLPMLVSGVALAVGASALAAWALFRIGGTVPAVAWLLVPTSVFTLVPYTESLFCAAAFWAWERARLRRWPAAAALAALACALRVSGVFLVAALAVLALSPGRCAAEPTVSRRAERRPGRRPRRRTAGEILRPLAWLLLPLGVLLGYLGYLAWLTGSWTAWFDAQADGWSRGFTWPWDSLQHTLDATVSTAFPAYPQWAWVFRAEVFSMAFGTLVTVVCLLRRRWGEAVWVGLQVVAFSLSYWFFSVNRAVLLWFPAFLLAGHLFEARWWRGRWVGVRSALSVVLVVGLLAAQAWWAWLFFSGDWAS